MTIVSTTWLEGHSPSRHPDHLDVVDGRRAPYLLCGALAAIVALAAREQLADMPGDELFPLAQYRWWVPGRCGHGRRVVDGVALDRAGLQQYRCLLDTAPSRRQQDLMDPAISPSTRLSSATARGWPGQWRDA